MKRLVAVCLTAALMLAVSTAAFATPTITVTQSGDVSFSSTVNSGFTKVFAADHSSTITWFQPYDFTAPAPDFSAYPPGGILSGPTIDITGAKLTIIANGINPGLTVPVWRGTGTSSWAAQIGTLTPSGAWNGLTDSTTVITLADADAWLAPTGFYLQVRLPGTSQDDVVKSSKLELTTQWSYTYEYEEPVVPPQPPVVPAPGAILLASMGAGLVSWLRARKAL